MARKDPEKQKAYDKEYGKKYREDNKEAIRARQKAYDDARKEERRVYDKKRREDNMAENPEYDREKNLRRYGLSIEQWSRMLKEQGGVCVICGTDNWGKRGPHTEHCHTTKRVRGIACKACNIAIGEIKDNPETALKIHWYLLESLI